MSKFDDYADRLSTLIDDAVTAVSSGAKPRMREVATSLDAFMNATDDSLPGVVELDNIAAATRRNITLALLNGQIDDLAAQSPALVLLTKRYGSQTAENAGFASALTFEFTRSVLDATTTAVEELKKLKAHADDTKADGKKIAKMVQDAIDAVAAVRALVVKP